MARQQSGRPPGTDIAAWSATLYQFKRENVYISGRMTGIVDLNEKAFMEAERFLRACGYWAYNPIRACKAHHMEEWTHEACMRWSLNVLTNGQYKYIYMLPGWFKSQGARLEYEVAVKCGIQPIDGRWVLGREQTKSRR